MQFSLIEKSVYGSIPLKSFILLSHKRSEKAQGKVGLVITVERVKPRLDCTAKKKKKVLNQMQMK